MSSARGFVSPGRAEPPRVLFLGRTTLDLLYRLDGMPEEDTKVYARDLQTAPGGPALNAAVTHALLGGRSMLISAVAAGRGPRRCAASSAATAFDFSTSPQARTMKRRCAPC